MTLINFYSQDLQRRSPDYDINAAVVVVCIQSQYVSKIFNNSIENRDRNSRQKYIA